MSRILTCGFESGGDPLKAELSGSLAGNALTTQSTIVHAGSYAAKTRTDVYSSGLYAELRRTSDGGYLVSGDTLFYRIYYRVPAAPGSATGIWSGGASNGTEAWSVTLRTDNRLVLTNVVANKTKTTAFALTANTHYRLEVKHVISDTSGSITLRIYSDDDINPTLHEELVLDSADAAGDTLPAWGNVGRMTIGSAGFFESYYDDLAVNTSEGTALNSWCGPGRVVRVAPGADTAVTWTKAGSSPAGTNYGGVDEADPNDGTDYNESSDATGQEDKLGLVTLPSAITSTAAFVCLDLYARVGGNQTGSQSDAALKLWDQAGAATVGPTFSCAVNGWKVLSPVEHLAFNPGTRTKANVQSFSIGYKTIAGAAQVKRVSALWLNVEWKETAQQGATLALPTALAGVLSLPIPTLLLAGAPPSITATPSPVILVASAIDITTVLLVLGTHPGTPSLVRVNAGDQTRPRLQAITAGSEVYLEVAVRNLTQSAPHPLMDPVNGVLVTMWDPSGDVVLSSVKLGKLSTGKYFLRHQTMLADEKGIYTVQFHTLSSGRAVYSPEYAVFRLL